VLGGGVLRQPALLPLVRRRVGDGLAGYASPLADAERTIVAAALGDRAGVLGAMALAHEALASAPRA
jgi:fructokinase